MRCLILIVIVISLLFFSGCNFESDTLNKDAENEDTPPNEILTGKDGGLNSECDRTDSEITDDQKEYLLYDGWIYYSNVSDNYSLYKIRTDGSERTKLNDDQSRVLQVSEDWIYYINGSDGASIYRINTDGKRRTKINDQRSGYLVVAEGWLYFTLSDNEDPGMIYKILPDGSGKTQLNSDPSRQLVVHKDWVYYAIPDYDYQIYRVRTNGTERELFIEDYFSRILALEEDWIYYRSISLNGRSGGPAVYRIGLDGRDKEEILNADVHDLVLTDDWLYYTDASKGGNIYRVKRNGSDHKLVSGHKGCAYLFNSGDWIIYHSGEHDYNIFMVSVNGARCINLNGDHSWWLQLVLEEID